MSNIDSATKELAVDGVLVNRCIGEGPSGPGPTPARSFHVEDSRAGGKCACVITDGLEASTKVDIRSSQPDDPQAVGKRILSALTEHSKA